MRGKTQYKCSCRISHLWTQVLWSWPLNVVSIPSLDGSSRESTSTLFTAAEALNRFYLWHKVVVECKFLSRFDFSGRNENDVSLSVDGQVLRYEVGLTRVVDIASFAAKKCSIDDVVSIESKIVAVADAELIVGNLSFVSNWIPDFLANVLNNDVLRCQSIVLSSF